METTGRCEVKETGVCRCLRRRESYVHLRCVRGAAYGEGGGDHCESGDGHRGGADPDDMKDGGGALRVPVPREQSQRLLLPLPLLLLAQHQQSLWQPPSPGSSSFVRARDCAGAPTLPAELLGWHP